MEEDLGSSAAKEAYGPVSISVYAGNSSAWAGPLELLALGGSGGGFDLPDIAVSCNLSAVVNVIILQVR